MKKFTIFLTLALLVVSLAIPSYAAEPDAGNVLIGGSGGFAFVPGLSQLPSADPEVTILNQLPIELSGYSGYAIFTSPSHETFVVFAPRLVIDSSSMDIQNDSMLRFLAFDSENNPLDSIPIYVLHYNGSEIVYDSEILSSGSELPYTPDTTIVVGPETYFPSFSSLPEFVVSMGTIEDTNPPGILTVFSKVAGFLPRLLLLLVPMFWVSGEGLTFVGLLAVASLAIAVSFLIFGIIQRWLKFRG